jgi:hypothetical protein
VYRWYLYRYSLYILGERECEGEGECTKDAMGTHVSEEMLTSPLKYLDKWQRMVDRHPKIAAQFHEIIFGHNLKLSKDYYDEVALHLALTNAKTLKVDATLLAALAEHYRTGWNPALGRHRNAFRYGDRWKTDPQYPYSADALVAILTVLPTRYSTFFRHCIPESEDDLYKMALWMRSRYVKQEKKKKFISFFRKHGHLIQNPHRFFELENPTINLAVFSGLPVEERKVLCKERQVVGSELLGVPMTVYSPYFYGEIAKDIWMLHSAEWSVEEKAEMLNKRGLPQMYKDGTSMGNDGHVSNSWGAGTYITDINPCHYYGPVLFPEKIIVDFEDRLNSTGVKNLVRYCLIIPAKIKFKLSGDSKKYWDDFVDVIDTDRAQDWVKKHIAK